MKRVLATALLLGSAFGCNGSGAAAPAVEETGRLPKPPTPLTSAGPSALSSQIQHARLTIEGMVCQGCAEAAKHTLQGVAGVVSAETDLQSGTARVSFDPRKTSVGALAAAIEGVDRDPAPAFRVTAQLEGH